MDGAPSIGAADAGFETPQSVSQDRVSNLATGALKYTETEGEATRKTREDYDEMFRYKTKTEEQSLQAADNLLYYEVDGKRTFIKEVDPEGYADIVHYLTEAPAWNGIMTDAAMLIKKELQDRSLGGEITHDEYTGWLETIREHATDTGRGSQAWAKWTREDNRNGEATEIEAWDTLQKSTLSDEEKHARFDSILQYDQEIDAAETSDSLKDIILRIADERGTTHGITNRQSNMLGRIASHALDSLSFDQLKQFAFSSASSLATDTVATDIGRKAKTIQVLNMLSNPKTPAKNLTGNTSFYGVDAMSLRGAALLDMVLSKITGTRSVAFERFALNKEGRDAISKAIQMSLAEVTMDVDMGGNNRYQTGGRRTFKAGGVGVLNTNTAVDKFAERVLSALERNMGYLMTTSDEAYKGAARATQHATQRLIDAGKIKTEDEGYAARQADDLAYYRTFQNRGKIATAIQTVHDVLNIIGFGDSGKVLGTGESAIPVHSFGLGDLVAPFTRVAGNLAAVGMDYSPVNAVKGTVEILDVVRRAAVKKTADPARQARAVSDFARGMTGSAIAYAVVILAKAGLITRAEDEDDRDVAALNQSEGVRGTQINIDAAKRWVDGGSQEWRTGDTLIDLSNLEPLNFIISLGVELADNQAENFISTFGDVETYKDTVASAIATAGDLPILSGVGDFARDVLVYGTDPVASGAEMLGKTAISSVTPNIVAALAKGLDDKQRNIYSEDDVASVLIDNYRSRIPWRRQELPITVNTLGEAKDNPGTLTERLLNSMLNPIGVNEYTQSAVSKEMERVREETGEVGFYPATRKPKALTYTDDEGEEHEVKLTYDQRQEFQTACSKTQMSASEEMIGSSLYKRASDSMKAELLSRVSSFAYQKAKAQILGDDSVEKWVLNAQTAKKDIGVSQSEFLYYYEKYGPPVFADGDVYNKTKSMVKAGLTIDQWAKMKKNVDSDGNGSVKKAELTAYIQKNFPAREWRKVFDAYKGSRNWKNPY